MTLKAERDDEMMREYLLGKLQLTPEMILTLSQESEALRLRAEMLSRLATILAEVSSSGQLNEVSVPKDIPLNPDQGRELERLLFVKPRSSDFDSLTVKRRETVHLGHQVSESDKFKGVDRTLIAPGVLFERNYGDSDDGSAEPISYRLIVNTT